MHERNVVAVAEQVHDLLAFAEAQQAVVDEHAGELLADRLVDQHGGDRGVDAAGQAADHPALADLRADPVDRLVLEGAHGPVAGRAGDFSHEIAQQRGAARRVHHLGMELHRVELALLVRDGGKRRVVRDADHLEAIGQPRDAVAVAHPHGVPGAFLPDALEQRGVLHHLDLGAAEFAVMSALDLAAELRRHRLLAVADAEHRHAGIENGLRSARRRRFGHRGGAAGEDHAARLHRGEGVSRLLERDDLAIDPLLADAPGDELGNLGAEIDDENLVVGCHGEQLPDRPGGRNRLSHSYLLFEP